MPPCFLFCPLYALCASVAKKRITPILFMVLPVFSLLIIWYNPSKVGDGNGGDKKWRI